MFGQFAFRPQTNRTKALDPPFQAVSVRLFSPHQSLIDRFTSPNEPNMLGVKAPEVYLFYPGDLLHSIFVGFIFCQLYLNSLTLSRLP